METSSCTKVAKIYTCNCCDYNTSRKSSFIKHIGTVKHKSNVAGDKGDKNGDGKVAKSCKENVCKVCNKIYYSRNGLWKHTNKKCCNLLDNETQNINFTIDNSNDTVSNYVPTDISSMYQVMTNNEIISLLKQNNDLQTQMIELCKNGTIGSNNNNNNINSNNKTFNMNVFLNEHCKDAMNISEFVDSIQLGYADLVSVGKLGYVEGISSIIIKKLRELDIHKRPMHCGDEKRHSMYIKEDGKWEKDESDNKRLKKLIRQVAFKNTKNTFLFREKYPDCVTSASRYSDQYNKIVIESFGGKGNNDAEKEDKMVRMIAKAVYIDKSL